MKNTFAEICVPSDRLDRARTLLESDDRASTRKFLAQVSADFVDSARVLVCSEAIADASAMNFKWALSNSPRQSVHPNIERNIGGEAASDELAKRLLDCLQSQSGSSLFVPASLVVPADLPLLPPSSTRHLSEVDGELCYRLSAPQANADAVRKALGQMMSTFPTGWLLQQAEGQTEPVAAFIKVFDGDGWLLFGTLDYHSPQGREIH